MTLTQLQYFITVAKFESMTRAAEELHLEQPALSRSIARLEEDLGFPLFDRRGRVIVLNESGKLFLDFAQQCINSYGKVQYAIARQSHDYYGSLTIGTSIKSSRVYDILSAFHRRWPSVHLTAKHVKSPEKATDCDFIFGLSDYESTYLRSSFRVAALWKESTCLLISDKSPLATGRSVNLSDAAETPFILSLDQEFHDFSEKFFHMANFSPVSLLRTDDPNLVFYMVQQDLAVALMPEFTPFYDKLEDVLLLPISVPEYHRQIFLFEAQSHRATKVQLLFREFVEQHCQKRFR